MVGNAMGSRRREKRPCPRPGQREAHQHSLRAGESKGARESATANEIGSGLFSGSHREIWRLAWGHAPRSTLRGDPSPRARSDLISHSADSDGVRGGGDWIAEAGASALASASSQLRVTPASLIEAAGVEESEEGSKGKTSLPTAATPSAGWLIPQDWPPAEAPTSSRLTGILRPGSDSRNATIGRGSSAFQPRLELPRLLTFRTSRAQASRDAGGESRRRADCLCADGRPTSEQ
jgi:hypothetical protein